LEEEMSDDIKIAISPESWNRVVRERDEAREERDKLKQLLAADSENVDAYLGVCIERDEAREDLDEEKKFHHRTHAELIQTQCKLLDMQMGRDEAREAIIATLEENRHLADGEDCTLAKLKSVVPDWK
jgi:hypothetical protein